MDIQGSKIMVVGGAGHIGSHIVDELVENGANVKVYDNLSSGRETNLFHNPEGTYELIRGDIRDLYDLTMAMKGCDYVIHTASLLLLESREKPDKAIDVNIKGTWNVIRAALEVGISKIIFSSTGSVYGEPLSLPMTEEHPYNSETIYGTTKIAGEHLFRDYYKSHAMNFVGLRYFNVYGPRQHYKGAYAQIIPRWVDKIFAGEPLTILGDGSQTMDMTYVTDVAHANVLALESDITNEFINVGTGKQTSVKELAELMNSLVKSSLPITYIPQDVNLVKNRKCSTEKAKKLLGFEAQVPVLEGLKKYYEWRLKTYI